MDNYNKSYLYNRLMLYKTLVIIVKYHIIKIVLKNWCVLGLAFCHFKSANEEVEEDVYK